MPKPSIVVDKSKLEQIIKDLESKQKFEGHAALFKAVSEEYNKVANPQITPSIVYLRVKSFNIPIKTTKSKVGRGAGKEDKINVTNSKQTVAGLLVYAEGEEKTKFAKLAGQVIKGSRKAAIKLNCLQCAAYSKNEI